MLKARPCRPIGWKTDGPKANAALACTFLGTHADTACRAFSLGAHRRCCWHDPNPQDAREASAGMEADLGRNGVSAPVAK